MLWEFYFVVFISFHIFSIFYTWCFSVCSFIVFYFWSLYVCFFYFAVVLLFSIFLCLHMSINTNTHTHTHSHTLFLYVSFWLRVSPWQQIYIQCPSVGRPGMASHDPEGERENWFLWDSTAVSLCHCCVIFSLKVKVTKILLTQLNLCVCVCVCFSLFACECVCRHVFVCVCVNVCACMWVSVHDFGCMGVCVCVCMCVCRSWCPGKLSLVFFFLSCFRRGECDQWMWSVIISVSYMDSLIVWGPEFELIGGQTVNFLLSCWSLIIWCSVFVCSYLN